MKKHLSIFLAALLALSLTACDGNKTSDDTSGGQQVSDTNEPGGDTDEVAATDPLELLNTVWNSYGDNEKFSVVGGDLSEEHVTTDAPGIFSIDDAVTLNSSLAFPETSADKIDSAASMVHMLNANTFTCGAFHLINPEDKTDVSAAIKDNVMQRQWICGFPEKLVILTVNDCIIVSFGTNDLVDLLRTKLIEAYGNAEVFCDEPIMT